MYKGYKIDDPEKKKTFAVKQIKQPDNTKLDGHTEEYHMLKGLNHPNIVKVVELFVNDVKGIVHIILEYVDGKEMQEHVAEKGPFSEEEARHIFKQVMEAIAYLHAEGICHRDIKP